MVAKRREGRPLRHRCRIVVERARTNNQVDGWGWAPSVVVDDSNFFFYFFSFCNFVFFFLLPLVVDVAPGAFDEPTTTCSRCCWYFQTPVRPFFISFSFFSLHSEARENTGQGPTHYTVVYTVHNYYLCPSLAVFLCVLLLSSLGCIYAVAKTHHSLNYSIWTRDFSPVFFWGLLVFSRIPFGTLHRHPPPLFFRLALSTVYLGTCIHFFFDFSTKWKNKFFFILKFKNGRFVPVFGRSISITIKWREGKKK